MYMYCIRRFGCKSARIFSLCACTYVFKFYLSLSNTETKKSVKITGVGSIILAIIKKVQVFFIMLMFTFIKIKMYLHRYYVLIYLFLLYCCN